MVTAGPMRGKIRAKVEANTIAKMQAAVAKEGLYVRGYTAVVWLNLIYFHSNKVTHLGISVGVSQLGALYE